jgi:drug/metabolite transporter (DMT)-like permease
MSVPAAYVGVILIWSTTPLAIQWSSVGAGYLFALVGRMAIGVVMCFVLVKLLRTRMPWHRAARRVYLAAGLGIYGAMSTTYWGAQFIPSGLVSVLFGLTPLFTSVMAFYWLRERSLTLGRISGIALGFFGLVVIFGSGWSLGARAIYGIAAVLIAVAIQCASMVWVKRLGSGLPALAVTTGALYIAMPLFLLTWGLGGAAVAPDIPRRAAWAIVYLGLFGSVLGFVLYFYVIKHLAAASIAMITLVTPVLALLLGTMLNGERLTAALVSGVMLILLGLALHQWGDGVLMRVRRAVVGEPECGD